MNKELFHRQLQMIFDLIEYWYLRAGEKDIFDVRLKGEWELDIEDTCVLLKLTEERFSEYIKIVHIYDFVNEEHWLPVPPQEYPDGPRPVAELKIKKPFTEFKDAFNAMIVQKGVPRTLKGNKASYDEKTFKIKIGEDYVQLPPNTFESDVTKILFQYKPGEVVDWSIIDEIIKGGKDFFDEKSKRSIRDTRRRVNNKVKEEFLTTEELFSAANNGVWRNI